MSTTPKELFDVSVENIVLRVAR